VKTLILDASETATLAEMAPTIQGKTDFTQIKTVDLETLGFKYRWQKIIFETARDVFEMMKPDWQGNREYLLAQVIRIVEEFLSSNKVHIEPPLFYQDDLRRRIIFTLNMSKIVHHIWESIRFDNTEKIEPVFDTEKPIRSTGDMRSWYTAKPCEYTKKSHINFCVYDSTWEASESFELDRNSNVESWVKNDHLGFQIPYIYNGIVHKYYPDFIIKLKTCDFLVLEIKGEETEKDKTKRNFLDEWVRAVNEHGGFGKWKWAVSRHPGDVGGILANSVVT
jgi:type III restriction enzyme